MKKERCFYLDFVRAIAVISILLTHYNARWIYMNSEDALKKAILTTRVANVYIGDFGVSLFLIISGAALMYTYSDQLDLKKFYVKRMTSIYPMFWIGYFFVFAHSFLVNGGINESIPKWNILLTVIGMDGYLGTVLPSFYLIGEWFLGFIIIIYVLFPLLRKGTIQFPKITAIIVLGLYILFMFNYNIPFIKNIFLFIRLLEVVFGMYFVKYIRRVNGWFTLTAAGVLVLNCIIKPQIDASLQMTYVGISAFLVLTWISNFIQENKVVVKCCGILSKYSYAIFLTHHYIIAQVVSKIDLSTVSISESYILFIIICCLIGVFSRLLFVIHDYIIKNIKMFVD